MLNEDGIPPTQETTGDSEANTQPDNEYVFTNLPNYLINPSKKGEDADFLSNVSEDNRETGLGYDSAMIVMIMPTKLKILMTKQILYGSSDYLQSQIRMQTRT